MAYSIQKVRGRPSKGINFSTLAKAKQFKSNVLGNSRQFRIVKKK